LEWTECPRRLLVLLEGRGLYIGNPPAPLGEEKYQPMSFGGKNMKSGREKGKKGEKVRKGEVKG
jgi:hypothetical protein